ARAAGRAAGSAAPPSRTRPVDSPGWFRRPGRLRRRTSGVMQAGGDLVNVVKQYNEFKLKDQGIKLAIGLLFDTDINALGPDAFAGVVYTTPWQWTIDADARAWADRFKQRTSVRPTFAHAGNYSAAWQYM